jgi:hypothetical protein
MIAPVAGLELSIIVAVVVAAIVGVAIWLGADRVSPALRSGLGVVAGVLGALLVLTEVADLIPDAVEVWLIPIWIGIVTAALMVISIRSLAD